MVYFLGVDQKSPTLVRFHFIFKKNHGPQNRRYWETQIEKEINIMCAQQVILVGFETASKSINFGSAFINFRKGFSEILFSLSDKIWSEPPPLSFTIFLALSGSEWDNLNSDFPYRENWVVFLSYKALSTKLIRFPIIKKIN